jgi:hypothetical protein
MGGSCCKTKETPNSEVTIEQMKAKPKCNRAAVVIQSVMASYLETRRVNKIKTRRSIQGAGSSRG